MRRLLVAALVCGLLAPAAATAKEPIGGMKVLFTPAPIGANRLPEQRQVDGQLPLPPGAGRRNPAADDAADSFVATSD